MTLKETDNKQCLDKITYSINKDKYSEKGFSLLKDIIDLGKLVSTNNKELASDLLRDTIELNTFITNYNIESCKEIYNDIKLQLK